MNTPLPAPSTSRFKPLRSGLLNLFKYEDQEFWFEHGRLLIRGNNGTGKSRVLALQLPFLLDGEISPRRVEPDGDPARRMDWHLLMDVHEQRTGYTWIEFGRIDDAGEEQFVTIGCGMRAIHGGENQPSRWFFLTQKRVGLDFTVSENQHPLSKDRLLEVLGTESLFESARDYRVAIDRHLFGLGASRYKALLELLIRLRSPQLSKKLEEKTLFEALSLALPTLPEEIIQPVASAFKKLDELRAEHEQLKGLAASLADFCSAYQSYLQTAIQLRAAKLRSLHASYESAQRRVNEIEDETRAAHDSRSNAVAAAKSAQDRLITAEARYDALQSSAGAQEAQKLSDAKQRAQDKESSYRQAEERSRNAENAQEQRFVELNTQQSLHDERLTERDAYWKMASQQAVVAGIAKQQSLLLPAGAAWSPDRTLLSKLKENHDRLTGDHEHRLHQIDEGLRLVGDRLKELVTAEGHVDRFVGEMQDCRDQAEQHDQQALAQVGNLASVYAVWHSSLQWLKMPNWSELAPSFDEWLETAQHDQRSLAPALSEAVKQEATALATAKAALDAQRIQLESKQSQLVVERDQLLAAPPSPIPPSTRDAASRVGRVGAPLWQLCEFRPELSAIDRVGLEAALESSGLLDAWVTPEGVLEGEFPADTFLTAKGGTNAPGNTLSTWLIPDMHSGDILPAHVVLTALSCIGAGITTSSHWVGVDGRWQLGPITGKGVKAQAQFLGASSREAARQARLAEVRNGLEEIAEKLSELQREETELREREYAAHDEAKGAPTDNFIADALNLRTDAQMKLAETSRRHADAQQKAYRARQAHEEARDKLREEAAYLGFSEHLGRLQELRPAWGEYGRHMEQFWTRLQSWSDAALQLEAAKNRHLQASEIFQQSFAEAEQARRDSLEALEIADALEASSGASAIEHQRLEREAKVERTSAKAAEGSTKEALGEIDKQIAILGASLKPAQEKVNEIGSERAEAIRALRVPLLHGLFIEAIPSFADIETDDWSPTRAITIARRIGRDLPDVSSDDESRRQQSNMLNAQFHQLQNRTGQACEVESEEIAVGLVMVQCRWQGSKRKPAECLALVETERSIRDRLLGEQERGIIDRHLVAEVSITLQTHIEGAQERTRLMNEEMTRCATTLGVTLRLCWEARTEDMPAGLPQVRKLLLADHSTWTDAERRLVGDFLHARIQHERLASPQATAAEQLLQALDYRYWHQFYAERRQNDKWERLTKKKYGTGSGGEKAIMLTIPQMAAASSHYRSAADHAPRFILLDEAFAGVDTPTRAKLMGLLNAFDLDLMMTSDREWATYSTVSGIAIYQLVANADAIAATRWTWNGSVCRLAPVPDSPEFRKPLSL